MKRYLLLRYQEAGMGAGMRWASVIEQANSAPPPEVTGRHIVAEVREVAADTPLSEWRPVLPEAELPAALVPSEGGE